MRKSRRFLSALLLAAMAVGPISMAPAFAQQTSAATQVAQTGTVTGTVTDAQGAPIADATVRLNGSAAYTARTDNKGSFTINDVNAGFYTVSVSKPGYQTAKQNDFAVLRGETETVSVSMQAATFSSLRDIASVRTRRGASRFNTTPASTNIVTAQDYANQASPQVQRVLDQTPGIVIDHPGTSATNASAGAITFPSIRGGLGFETASLVDGHPLAVGTYGDYVTTFLNSYFLQSSEIIKGPGATAPEVNYAIGGTVNFRTKDPTLRPAGEFVAAVDNRGGNFSNLLYTGTTTNGKLGWVLGYGVNGQIGPMSNQTAYWNLPSSAQINGKTIGFTTNPVANAKTNGIQNNPYYYSSTGEACCFPVSQVYDNKTELVKLRYKLSGNTVFTGSYLGSQTWTDQNGNHVYGYNQAFTPGAGYTGSLAANSNVFTFQNVYGPPGEWEVNNEPIFQGELRTTLKNDTILARWYGASINRLQYNALNSPTQSYSMNETLYGTFAGQNYNGQNVLVTFPATVTYYCLKNNTSGLNWLSNPYATNPATGSATCNYNASGKLVATGGVATAQAVADSSNSSYFRSAEEDKIHGLSFSYDHPIGQSDNRITLAYDRNTFRTHSYSYVGDPKSPPSIPDGSAQTQGTALVRGTFQVTPKLQAIWANYFNTYDNTYSYDGGATFQNSHQSHYDTRLALTYRANTNASYRFSAGSAIAPPYLSLINGVANPIPSAPQPGATFVTSSAINPNLKPETSFGYDFGADYRLDSDLATTLSWDVYTSNLFNQFAKAALVTCNFWNFTTNNCDNTSSANTLPLVTTQNVNITNVKYQGLEVALQRNPLSGFGYKAQGALLRAYPYNLPPCFYSTNPVANCNALNTNLGIISGVNFYGSGTGGSPGTFNAVNNHAIPYSQAYLELNWRNPQGWYGQFGTQLYGSHNSLNVPAFWVANATLRAPLGDRQNGLSAQVSVDNLFNAYPNTYITAFGGMAVPLVNGNLGLTNANVIGPSTLKFVITKNFGTTP